MRNIFILAAILALAETAQAWPLVSPSGQWAYSDVNPYKAGDGTVTHGATESAMRLDGWRDATEQEKDDKASADAAAQAQAALSASLPQTFATGIAVTNAAGHWVQFIPDGTNVVAETLALQVSQSPLTPAQHDAMLAAALAARAAKRAKAKAAKAKGNGVPALAERIAAIEALLGVEP